LINASIKKDYNIKNEPSNRTFVGITKMHLMGTTYGKLRMKKVIPSFCIIAN